MSLRTVIIVNEIEKEAEYSDESEFSASYNFLIISGLFY